MNDQGQIPRTRGGVSGALLILLGLWGGLAPFVGPYFHFGYLPDTTWHYSTGRLYYSIIPAAAVLLGGLMVVLTRNRGVGIAGGVLAALGGLWFALGEPFVTIVLKHASVTAGNPVPGTALRVWLESIALFGGLGLLVVFLGALAIGRFSTVGAQDVDSYYADAPSTPPAGRPGTGQYQSPDFPDAPTQFPTVPSSPFPDTTATRFPGSDG